MKKQKQRAARFEDYLKEKLRDPKFRREYEKEKKAVFLAHEIIQLRRKLRLTQAQLAKRMGTSQQAVSRLESGEYEGFTLGTLQKLAQATRTELEIHFRSPRKKTQAG